MTVLLIVICLMACLMSVGGFWCYRRGLNDGLRLSTGNKEVIAPVSPVKAIAQMIDTSTLDKAAKELEKQYNEGLANIFGYDGKPQTKQGE